MGLRRLFYIKEKRIGMTWTAGNQIKKDKKNIHKELFQDTEGYLSEKEAQRWAVKYFRSNIGAAVQHTMGVKLFPFQEIIIKTMLQKDYVLGVLSRGIGKCSCANTSVLTTFGIKKLKDLAVGEKVYTLNGYHKVIDKFENEAEEGFVIKTKCGTKNKVKNDHRLYVYNVLTEIHEFIFASDLSPESHLIPVPINNEFSEYLKENTTLSQDDIKNESRVPQRLRKADFYYDEVSSIETEIFETIGITVENEHNYWGNGIINHNSFSTAIYAGLEAMFTPGSKIAILSRCLDENDYIPSSEGFTKAKELVVGSEVHSAIARNKILDKWRNPLEDGLKVTLKNGVEYTGKIGHKNLTLRSDATVDYELIENLREGDHIPFKINTDIWGDKSVLKDFTRIKSPREKTNYNIIENEELFYLLGAYLGDGFVSTKDYQYELNITSNDDEILNRFKNYFKPSCKCIYPKNGDTKYFRIYSKKIKDFFKYLGLGEKAISKNIPLKLRCIPKKYMKQLLSGLFDTDGSIYHNKDKNYAEIALSTSSRELAKQVQLILFNFGINCSIHTEKARGKIKICGIDTVGRESYKVRITGAENQLNFKNEINFQLKRKKDKLEKFLETANFKCLNRIPLVGKRVKKENSKHLVIRDNLVSENAIKIIGKSDIDPKIKGDLLKTCNFRYSPIVKIEKVKTKTIDITVDKEKNYVGNGVISKNTFRQSRMLFQTLEDISKKTEASLLGECMKGSPKHANDEWKMEFTNGSTILALPLGDGAKLRGFRFNCIIIDELLLMPEKILNEVIMPFISTNANVDDRAAAEKLYEDAINAGLMTNDDYNEIKKSHPLFKNNKLIGLSSASYQFEYLYTLYKDYVKKIKSGTNDGKPLLKDGSNKLLGSYAVFQMSYDIAPKGLYNEALLEKSKAEMSKAQFQREFGSQFTDDSSGYFNAKALERCSVQPGAYPCSQLKGKSSSKYVLAIDPNASESDVSDFFAMGLFRLDEDDRYTQIHTYGVAGSKYSDHIRYFHYLMNSFNIEFIVMDNGGGVQFLRACQESKLFKDSKTKLEALEDTNLSVTGGEAELTELRKFRKEYNKEAGKIVYFQKFNSDWLLQSNENLQASVDNADIRFSSGISNIDSEFKKCLGLNIGIDKLKFTGDENIDFQGNVIEDDYKNFDKEQAKRAKQIDLIEHQEFLITLTKRQIASIEPETSTTGASIRFVLPKELRNQKGRNRARRDLYTAVLMGNWGIKKFRAMQSVPKEVEEDWIPEIF